MNMMTVEELEEFRKATRRNVGVYFMDQAEKEREDEHRQQMTRREDHPHTDQRQQDRPNDPPDRTSTHLDSEHRGRNITDNGGFLGYLRVGNISLRTSSPAARDLRTARIVRLARPSTIAGRNG